MTIVWHGALLVVANLCLFAGGAGVTRLLGLWARRDELRRVIGLSYIAGVAAFSIAAQFLYIAGLAMTLWESLVLCAALAATGLIRTGGNSRPWPRGPSFGAWEVAAAGFAALVLGLLALDSLVQPLASWDAWTQWTPKARALVVVGGLDPDVLGSAVYRHWHLDYPLLVPSLEAFAFRFTGIDYRAIHFQQWFLLFGFALAFVDLLRPRVRPLFVWSVLLAILWAPKIEGETIAANADIALAVMLGLAGIAMFIWLVESDPRGLWLFVLFGAAAVETKLEGTYLVVVLCALTSVAIARLSPKRLPITLAASGIALATIIPWRIWVATHDIPATNSLHGAVTGTAWHDPSRGPIATLVVLGQFFSPRGWLLLAPLSLGAVAALALGALKARQQRVVSISVAVFAASGIAIAFAVPGPSFPYPWRASDSLLLAIALVVGAGFVATVARARGLAAWTIGTTVLMLGTFVAAYVVTPYPFAWILGTSSARVVLGPEVFFAAMIPLLLEQKARSSLRDGR